jgi:hypothetical protein
MEYDLSIHTNPDAKAWADLFCTVNPNCGIDHATMIGWFANAMMAMHDYLTNTKILNGKHLQYL